MGKSNERRPLLHAPAAMRDSWRLGRRVATLGRDGPACLKILTTALRLRLRSGDRGWTRLRLKKWGRHFSLTVSEYDDLLAIREVLVDEEYRLPWDADPKTILDLGSHIGASIIYFCLRYPEAAVGGVEPDPRTFAKLESNMRQFEQVQLRQAAVAGKARSGTLHRGSGSLGSFLRPSNGSGISVELATVDELCTGFGFDHVDLVKLDVEGSELDALRDTAILREAEVATGEVHPHLIDGSVEDFFGLFEGFDVEQREVAPTSVTFRARRPRRP